MKIKNIIYMLLAGVSFVACNDIDGNDRFIFHSDIDSLKSDRCVLLEDFTGQYCNNCPDAAREAHQILERFPDNVVVVSVHAGPLSLPVSKNGLAPEFTAEYDKFWQIPSYPKGVINRKGGAVDYAQWLSMVISGLVEENKVDMQIETKSDATARTASVKVKMEALRDIKGKLQVWLVEDSIIDKQLTKTGIDKEYTHQHVLRDAVNGIWGESVALKAYENDIFSYRCDSNLIKNNNWKMEHMKVVAFVYNNDEGVLQVTQKNLIEK